MSLFDAMAIARSSLTAQTAKMNTVAQNLANADTVPSSDASQMGVVVDGIVEVGGPANQEFNPEHPLADDDGYIYRPNINPATEMADLMQASRSFQNSIEAINTAKQLALRTLTLGK